MSDKVKRTSSGQFARGQSGNPAGARARKAPIMTTADISRTLMNIANRKTQLRTERGIETVNMVERNALVLGSGSKVGTAPRTFIELIKAAAMDLERRREKEEQKARGGGPR
ncbi:DUF5681 domain-containing protein [Sphingomonas phyllosphaerae]|uniref:DUF5681 domain-containing protein n=1 Tax=Sphingomonas phyllosphaerae TaxID=257003 RepID=UPI0003B659BE|nr:DUF5681 domain-containing protein [Sphingomonas phyllosphaerae]